MYTYLLWLYDIVSDRKSRSLRQVLAWPWEKRIARSRMGSQFRIGPVVLVLLGFWIDNCGNGRVLAFTSSPTVSQYENVG